MSAIDEENLTTDAFPSPPRSQENSNSETQNGIDNRRNRRHSDSGKSSSRHRENSESDDSNPPDPRKCCNTRFSRSHEGFQGPNAYASVINISNASGIQIGSNYTYYINSAKETNQKPERKDKDIPKTEKIILLLSSEERVHEKDIQFLSAHIDATWMETARKLDYSEGQISQFYCDFFSAGLKEVIYQFLLDWIRNNGANATAGKLATALWKSDQRQCVLKWSQK